MTHVSQTIGLTLLQTHHQKQGKGVEIILIRYDFFFLLFILKTYKPAPRYKTRFGDGNLRIKNK